MTTRSILFLCTGNLCRSPLAEGIARHLAGAELVGFSSAGTHALVGRPATPEAVEVAAEIGVDLRSHRARSLEAAGADLPTAVFGMEEFHLEAARRRWADVPVEMLDPSGHPIADPYGRPLTDYRQTRGAIEAAVRLRLDEWLG